MTYYWIVAQHSGKVLEVKGGSVDNCAKVIQTPRNQKMSLTLGIHTVLKWDTQNQGLPADPTCFSKDYFKVLKNTLQQCIPFIIFYNLTSKQFLDKLFPYRKILPKEFLDNDSKTSDKSKPHIPENINSKIIDSKIITFQHAETISKWINRLKITDTLTSSYEFKLLFHGSHDDD
ncbi:hypothetical protein C1645_839704 [Glomus cerebriforme]|uniref:Uncharacterized protein n=1 Tax=Glomus cerebriforme TaxID=658196 RepID=A0A397S1Q4_9GLOM|nr:hypothetical protein C1645_839704 [Glomus cerebriforme]